MTLKPCGFRVVHLRLAIRFATITLTALLICKVLGSHAEEEKPPICTEDAMIVFDASGSMSGDGWGYASANLVSRIEKVRSALAKVLPSVTRFRRVGLSGALQPVQQHHTPTEADAERCGTHFGHCK